MNSLIMCTAAVLNIFSAPAGYQVVGQVPYGVLFSFRIPVSCATGSTSESPVRGYPAPAVG